MIWHGAWSVIGFCFGVVVYCKNMGFVEHGDFETWKRPSFGRDKDMGHATVFPQ